MRLLFVLLVCSSACAPRESAPTNAPGGALEAPPATTPKDQEDPAQFSLEKGIVVEDLRLGAGPVAEHGKVAEIRFVLRRDDGVEIDSTEARGENFSFTIGDPSFNRQWEPALRGMRKGGLRRMRVPAGAMSTNERIPPGHGIDLEFELIDVR